MYIGLLKYAFCKYMHALHSQMILWYYTIEFRSLIRNTIHLPLFQNNSLITHEVNLGAPADTSNLFVYDW